MQVFSTNHKQSESKPMGMQFLITLKTPLKVLKQWCVIHAYAFSLSPPPPPPAFRVQTVSARGSTKFSYKHKKHRQFSVDRMVKERMHLSPKESGYAYLAEFHISHFTDDWQDCFVRQLKLSENN